MTLTKRILELNRCHPAWTSKELAAAAACSADYVRAVCHRHKLSRPRSPREVTGDRVTVRLDDGLAAWLDEEAWRMGPGVSASAVILAILRDAKAEDGR
jgi:hypothetical protein